MLNLTQVRGIGSATAGKLEAAGCTRVQDLLKISATDLSQQTGTSAKVAENIIQAATDLLKGLAGNSPVTTQHLVSQVANTIATNFADLVKVYRKVAKNVLSEDKYNEYRKAEKKYLKAVQKLDRDFASRGRVS